jgi:hypothetical protein
MTLLKGMYAADQSGPLHLRLKLRSDRSAVLREHITCIFSIEKEVKQK